jgi:hypothetical protein
VRGCAVPWWVVAFSWGDTDNRPEVPIISGCGSRVASAAGRPDHPDSVGRRGPWHTSSTWAKAASLA